MQEEFKALIQDALDEAGDELDTNLDEVAVYAAERATHLSTLVGQPGFALAVRAERDNVALKAALNAHQSATAMDARLVGIIQGALAFGARAIIGIA